MYKDSFLNVYHRNILITAHRISKEKMGTKVPSVSERVVTILELTEVEDC
jgi:hypothetical protein